MIMCSWELVKDKCMHVDTGPGSSKIVFTFICKAITNFFLCLITWEVVQTYRKSYFLFHSSRLVKHAALVYSATRVKWNLNFFFYCITRSPVMQADTFRAGKGVNERPVCSDSWLYNHFKSICIHDDQRISPNICMLLSTLVVLICHI